MKRIAFHTLGCKLNQYETDSIASQFRREGYTIVPFEERADCYVINSCTVTNKADRKSRNALNRAVRQADSGLDSSVAEASEKEGIVLLTGCSVDNNRDAYEASRATYLVDNKRKSHVFSIVDSHFRGEMVDPETLDPAVFSFDTPERIFHTRTTVKVQDGCDNFCTFCIIPFVRGRATSRPVEEILMQAGEAVRGGSRELVLTGVNMSRYESEGVGFPELLEKVLELPGEFRLRISSLEPDSLDDRFMDLFAHPKMAPHLHLCLQSGSERLLLTMRRMYTVARFKEIVAELRGRYPDFNLTTDIIVGFPGEGEQEFAESLAAAEEIGFSHIHTFPYSRREGTRADRMSDQVPEKVKQERSRRIRELSERTKRSYRERLVGKRQRLLVERVEEREGRAVARGLGEHYVPIRLEEAVVTPNRFVDVRIVGIDDGEDPDLLGELL